MIKKYFILALSVFCFINLAFATENCVTGYACKINNNETIQNNDLLNENKSIQEKINEIFKNKTNNLEINNTKQNKINLDKENNNNSYQKEKTAK